MKKMAFIPVLLLFTALSGHAEVFKCKQASGKINYQPSPCPSGSTEQDVVKIKELTPEQVEDAKAKLKIWQEGQAVEEEMKRQAEKERQDESRKQESLELQRRSVAAQELQMILEQQRQYQGGGGGGLYFPYNRRWISNPYYPRQFPYPPNDPNFFPRPHPHSPPFQSHDGMPAMPPPSPAEPIPSHDPPVPGNKGFGFR